MLHKANVEPKDEPGLLVPPGRDFKPKMGPSTLFIKDDTDPRQRVKTLQGTTTGVPGNVAKAK